MSTRKLILTALVCGLAIMLAGGYKLFQVATEDIEAMVYELGTEQTLGDMKVTVQSVAQQQEGTFVTVSMRGVEGADGFEGWKLLANGELSDPLTGTGVEPCTTKVSQYIECIIPFVPTVGASVTVAYQRAETQSQWAP